MSLYEMLFPDPARPQRMTLLSTIAGLNIPAVPRVRDAWPEKCADDRGVCVRVLARIGGGNRPDYGAAIDALRSLPTFVRDADETEWDSTYASFWFRLADDLPPEFVSALHEAASEEVDMAQLAERGLRVAEKRWNAGVFTPEEQQLRDQMEAALRGDGPPDGVIRI